ncbi:nucleotidyltransferase family protein [Rhizobium sp. R693]|uniref:nucleotidyltransferase family protein n=1 Tax=Rhizobium sp. R693 TaxID=1764276 RepID=UPI000B534079|nr:nucleotidyltransferase family protein [Rhizobium sp. R693]OWV98778.1 molybdopterin-guanine dinucleotide biosynthesis protein MobA [Rhizobium sp. R693]
MVNSTHPYPWDSIVILAAGKASRMGGKHKLLARFEGVPLVRRVAGIATASSASSVAIVIGHRSREIEQALFGLDVTTVFNPDYSQGLATSLIKGISCEIVRHACGAMILPADMPAVTTVDLNRLIEAFQTAGGRAIIRATGNGQRGNPVILPRALQGDVLRLKGDVGARDLIQQSGLQIVDVDIGEGAHLDVDTPEAVEAAGGALTT